MFSKISENYSLLKNQDSDATSKENLSRLDDEIYVQKALRDNSSKTRLTSHLAVIVALMLSVLANVFLIATLMQLTRGKVFGTVSAGFDMGFSVYAGLSRDPEVKFPYSTGYGPDVTNHSLLDERWEAIDINPGIVAISDEWAQEHNLSPTQRFPWDPSKGVYLITAFHTLHCLKNIHRILYDAHHGRPLSRDVGHALHCVDHLRMDAMCEADDFLLPAPKTRYMDPGPSGQPRTCKNWDALVDWAKQRSACYQHIDDNEERFASEHHEIERYANCPKGSPYEVQVQKFFEKSKIQARKTFSKK